MKRVATVLAKEAAAYLRSGLLAPSLGRNIPENHTETASFGVVLVPGVGANASQLTPIKLALRDHVKWFDAFEYSSFAHPRAIADRLRDRLDERSERCRRMLVIGHSLGGLLLRMALQSERTPRGIAGFVSICAPLYGTWLSRLSLNPNLRHLSPDSRLMSDVVLGAHRLESLKGSMLMIGSTFDQFVRPFESAFIDGEERLCLEEVGHVSALFDPRVHEAIVRLAKRLST